MACLDVTGRALMGTTSRRAKGAPAGEGEEGLRCLKMRGPPHARRISRRAEGAPAPGAH